MRTQGIFEGEQGPPWETLISPWDLFLSQGEQPVLDKEDKRDILYHVFIENSMRLGQFFLEFS